MAIVPTTDVNLATEVRDILNAAGGSVGNYLPDYFNKATAKINVNSLEKPMSISGVSGIVNKDTKLTDAEKKLCNYGYSTPVPVTIDTLTDYVRKGTIPTEWSGADMLFGWTYNPPKGGSADPFRMSDYCGYNSSQVNTFIFEGPDTVNYLSNEFSLSGKFPFKNFSYFDNYYFGIIICSAGYTTRGKFYVSDIPISQANGAVITLDSTYSGKAFYSTSNGAIHYVAPFLSDTPNVQNIVSTNSNYLANLTSCKTIPVEVLAIPFKSATTGQAVNPYPTITFILTVTSVSANTVTLSCSAKNTGSSSVTMLLTNLNYTVDLESYNIDDGQYVEQTNTQPTSGMFSTLTAAANTTTVLNSAMSITYRPYDSSNNAMITPFYININFQSKAVNASTNQYSYFSMGSCTIYFNGTGDWKQM